MSHRFSIVRGTTFERAAYDSLTDGGLLITGAVGDQRFCSVRWSTVFQAETQACYTSASPQVRACFHQARQRRAGRVRGQDPYEARLFLLEEPRTVLDRVRSELSISLRGRRGGSYQDAARLPAAESGPSGVSGRAQKDDRRRRQRRGTRAQCRHTRQGAPCGPPGPTLDGAGVRPLEVGEGGLEFTWRDLTVDGRIGVALRLRDLASTRRTLFQPVEAAGSSPTPHESWLPFQPSSPGRSPPPLWLPQPPGRSGNCSLLPRTLRAQRRQSPRAADRR